MSQAKKTIEVDDDVLEKVAEFSKLLFGNGIMGQDIDVSENEREALYTLGYGLYRHGRYEEASKVFSFLVVCDQLESRYQMAVGACAQVMGRFDDALRQYALVAVMRVDDPEPLVNSAECFIAMGRMAEAIETLELAIEIAEAKGCGALLAKGTAMREQLLRAGESSHTVAST